MNKKMNKFAKIDKLILKMNKKISKKEACNRKDN